AAIAVYTSLPVLRSCAWRAGIDHLETPAALPFDLIAIPIRGIPDRMHHHACFCYQCYLFTRVVEGRKTGNRDGGAELGQLRNRTASADHHHAIGLQDERTNRSALTRSVTDTPSLQIHRRSTHIPQLDPLIVWQADLRCGISHYLMYHHIVPRLCI